jgi:small subunit ribosomal protein S20
LGRYILHDNEPGGYKLATHKSAIKRNRQNAKRRLVNQMRRTRIKNLTKEVLDAVEAGDKEAAQAAFAKAAPVIQRTGGTSTLHRNTASRKVSRLAQRINAMESGE